MPTGTTFTLTTDRRTKMMEMLRSQWTVSGIAVSYGISYKTLIKLFKKHKINHKAVRMSGLQTLRADTFTSIADIVEPDKRVSAGLSFLKQYEIDDDASIDNVGSDTKDTTAADITAKIMLQMNGSQA